MDLIYLYFINIFVFLLYGWDKHLAVYHKFRIPEWLLLFFTVLGGSFGALCAMFLFRHKTRHPMFLICVPVFLLVHIVTDILLRIFVF